MFTSVCGFRWPRTGLLSLISPNQKTGSIPYTRLVEYGHREERNWSIGSSYPWLPFASTHQTVDISTLLPCSTHRSNPTPTPFSIYLTLTPSLFLSHSFTLSLHGFFLSLPCTINDDNLRGTILEGKSSTPPPHYGTTSTQPSLSVSFFPFLFLIFGGPVKVTGYIGLFENLIFFIDTTNVEID